MRNLKGLESIVTELRAERGHLVNNLRHVDAALAVLGKLEGESSPPNRGALCHSLLADGWPPLRKRDGQRLRAHLLARRMAVRGHPAHRDGSQKRPVARLPLPNAPDGQSSKASSEDCPATNGRR